MLRKWVSTNKKIVFFYEKSHGENIYFDKKNKIIIFYSIYFLK